MNDKHQLASGHHLITRWHLTDPNQEARRSRAISLRASAKQLRRDVEQRPWLATDVADEALARANEYETEAIAIDAAIRKKG